jgi:hypothetical protein
LIQVLESFHVHKTDPRLWLALAIPNPPHLKELLFNWRHVEVIGTLQHKELKLAPLCLDWLLAATRIVAIQSNGQEKDLTARPA